MVDRRPQLAALRTLFLVTAPGLWATGCVVGSFDVEAPGVTDREPSRSDSGPVVGSDGGLPLEGEGDAGLRSPPGFGEPGGCDGRDGDGDGDVDEGCTCEAAATQACYGGDPAVAGVGACALGAQACDVGLEFGSWGACTGWVAPSVELCDAIDNNCDGTVDEGCECVSGASRACYTGAVGTEGVGICRGGMQTCLAGAWGECTGWAGPLVEACNGLDDDCDGTVDEGCFCAPGATRACFEGADGSALAGTPGVGICRSGTESCVEAPGAGSDWGACVGAVGAVAEICANGLDDDCDGAVDEGCVPPPADCSVADVLFLVDTTGSMSGAISSVRTLLRDMIAPSLEASIGDVHFAVAEFRDFATGGYGSGGDRPFRLLQASTSSLASTQVAIDTLSAGGGNDAPESGTEALYQAASGEGIGSWVPARSCAPGTVGYPCFRAGSTPIIVMITDAPFHNGPGGSNPYYGISPTPHTFTQATSVLGGIEAKVIGISIGSGGLTDLRAVARDTGAVDAAGNPIVITTTGAGTAAAITEAVRDLCGR